jgi:hypothetical protein
MFVKKEGDNMDILKILKYIKIVVKIVTVVPVLIEGVLTIVYKVKKEIEDECL